MRNASFVATSILLFQCLFPLKSGAQQVRLDSVGSRLFIVYTDLDGVSRRAEVQPWNRIDPRVDVTVQAQSGGFEYRYAVENEAGVRAVAGLSWIAIPCADAEASPTAPTDWVASTFRYGNTTVPYCDFMTARAAIQPGHAASYGIVTKAFPGIATGRFLGEAEPLLWPSEEGTVPKAAHALADSLQGFETGGVNLPLVAPIRPPDAMDAPGKVIAALRGDLDRACELNWITNSGICTSLRVKLDHTAGSLEHGQGAAARGQLGSFLAELDAQHGPQPGKHVNDGAYWLLKTNAERLLELI
jgi:hypothetical protein